MGRRGGIERLSSATLSFCTSDGIRKVTVCPNSLLRGGNCHSGQLPWSAAAFPSRWERSQGADCSRPSDYIHSFLSWPARQRHWALFLPGCKGLNYRASHGPKDSASSPGFAAWTSSGSDGQQEDQAGPLLWN